MIIYAPEPREQARPRKRSAPEDPLRTLVGFADGTPVLSERSRKLAPLVEDPLVACCADCGTGTGCGGGSRSAALARTVDAGAGLSNQIASPVLVQRGLVPFVPDVSIWGPCFGSPWMDPFWGALVDACYGEAVGGTLPVQPCEVPAAADWLEAFTHFDIVTDLDFGVELFEDLDDNAILLGSAWALLLENESVLEWLLCAFSPYLHTDGLMDCLSELLHGDDLVDLAAAWPGRFEIMSAEIGGDTISFYPVAGSVWTDLYVEDWQQASTPAGQLCVLLTLAGTLLTELLHLCGEDHPQEESECDGILMVKNAFLSVMAQVYPCILESECCADYVSLWGNTAYNHPPPGGGC